MNDDLDLNNDETLIRVVLSKLSTMPHPQAAAFIRDLAQATGANTAPAQPAVVHNPGYNRTVDPKSLVDADMAPSEMLRLQNMTSDLAEMSPKDRRYSDLVKQHKAALDEVTRRRAARAAAEKQAAQDKDAAVGASLAAELAELSKHPAKNITRIREIGAMLRKLNGGG